MESGDGEFGGFVFPLVEDEVFLGLLDVFEVDLDEESDGGGAALLSGE